MNKKIFETKIKPVLVYIGSIGSVLTAIAYIVTIVVLIVGFKANKSINESIVFSIVSAIIGVVIMQFMKIQGIDFAKQLDENIVILKEYNDLLPRKEGKKAHSITYYWVMSVAKDIILKATMMAITTSAIIYIVYEGSQDWNMFLLAIVNLLMFICFGLLSLSNSYDFYNDKHIPYLKLKISEMKPITTEVIQQIIEETPSGDDI